MDKIKNTAHQAEKAFTSIKCLFLRKLADYGTDDIIGLDQVIVRIREKLLRIENLMRKGHANYESITDTFNDIAGYAVIGRLLQEGNWGKTDEKKGREEQGDEILIIQEDDVRDFPLPRPAKSGDVGYDLYTAEDVVIPARNEYPINVPTNISVKLPPGYWALITHRSSTPRKLGVEVVNGIIDNGYTGKLYAICYNRTNQDVLIKRGMRIAQFILLPIHTPSIRRVEKLPTTERGDTGFGSSGL